jgi:hypothetical protein
MARAQAFLWGSNLQHSKPEQVSDVGIARGKGLQHPLASKGHQCVFGVNYSQTTKAPKCTTITLAHLSSTPMVFTRP